MQTDPESEHYLKLQRRLNQKSRGAGLSLMVIPIIYGIMLSITIAIHGIDLPAWLYLQVGAISGLYLVLAAVAWLGWSIEASVVGIVIYGCLLGLQAWGDPVGFRSGWHYKIPILLSLLVGFAYGVQVYETLRQLKNRPL